jgi:hypothetical protein
MKRQSKIGIIVWLFLLMTALLTSASRRFTPLADAAVLLVLLAAMFGGSLYKICLCWRYRDHPEKREMISWSNHLFPERLRRFLMDEIEERTKSRDDAGGSKR